MSFFDIFRLVVLVGMLGWASYTDLRSGRIGNELTISGMVVALVVAMLNGGPAEFFVSLLGLLVGGGPLFAAFLLGLGIRKPLMGAGDVKLMAAIGAFVGPATVMGPAFSLWCLFYGMMIAGIYALLAIAFCMITRRKMPKNVALGASLAVGTILCLIIEGPPFGLLGNPQAIM